jgi:hypothetical protein
MAFGNFPKAAATTTKAAGKAKSRYAGISAATPRNPMPDVGEYLVKFLTVEEGFNPGKGRTSYKANLEIMAVADPAKQDLVGKVVFVTHNTGTAAGLSNTKAMVMAGAGYDDEAEYDAFDPDGLFIEACSGTANEYSARGTLIGRLTYVQVMRGGATPDGQDYFRNYGWCPCDEGQTVAKAK